MGQNIFKTYLSKIVSIAFSLLMLIICFFPGVFSLLFKVDVNVEDNSNEYVIERYDVDVMVRQDNSFYITEKVLANFFVPSNGIYRTLPKSAEVRFEEGGKKYSLNYKVKYSSMISSQLYKTDSSSSNFVFVQLGRLGANYLGEKEFELSYVVYLGDDRIGDFDQFYFNLIGNYWDTKINNTNITINFYKPVENQMYFYMGEYGSESGAVVSANEDKTTFAYSSNQTLLPGEGLTARIKLPQGYFDVSRSFRFDIILLVLVIIFAVIIIFTFKRTHNKGILIPVVNFEPPKGVNSAEVGYLIDGKVDNADVASLIVYWASKGYLKIREKGKNLYLSKLQTPQNLKKYEQTLFDKIFESEYLHEGQNEKEVDVKTLGEKIYMEVFSLKKQIEKENKDKIFKQSAVTARTTFSFLSAIIMGLVTFKVNYQQVSFVRIVIGLFISLIWFFVLLGLIAIKDKFGTYNNQKKKTKIIFFSIASVLILSAYSFVTYNFYCDPFFLTFLAVILAIISVLLIYKLNIRTDYGLKIQGDLVGLREFIELAEKDRLEMLVKENPQAFYEILPFAYVLGVSEVWINKFENIAIDIPTWYSSDSDFLTSYLLIRTLDVNLRRINTQINFKPVSNSSGSGRIGGSGGGRIGGGGFSGGGFGGGGGGRW